jgi:alpha-beta hydrolase superfamily lysophospholipase
LETASIVIGCVGFIYVAILAFLYFFQESLLFQSKTLQQNFPFDFDFPFEEQNHTMKDGAIINALFIPAKEEKGVILYSHGNAGSLQRWGSIAQYFTQFGYSVLVYDYRGYGKSTGKRSMQNLFDDALTLYQALEKSYNEDDIVIYGRSLGSGISTWLASKTNSKSLVLETPFYRVSDATALRLLIIPTEWFLKFPFQSYLYIKAVKSPIHIIHGTQDLIVPYASGAKLFKQNQNLLNITLTTIQGGKHNNLAQFDQFYKTINALLK